MEKRRHQHVRFTTKGMLAAVTVLCFGIGLWIRFSPHMIWRMYHKDIAVGVEKVPSLPLIASPLNEPTVLCRMDDISFVVPETLSGNVSIDSVLNHGRVLCMKDDKRSMMLQIPYSSPWKESPGYVDGFPEKTDWTRPRFGQAMWSAGSVDFSYWMSLEDLRWHKHLLTARSRVGSIKSVGFLSKGNIEGTLQEAASSWMFTWSTKDRRWEGNIAFSVTDGVKTDWIRTCCSSFSIDGDISDLEGFDEAKLLSLIHFHDSPAR